LRAVVIGSGAGGASAALKLAENGFKVTVLEAGDEFKPFTRNIQWAEPLRRMGVLGSEKTISRVFHPMNTLRSSKDLILVRGITTGGSTVLTCGNLVRTERGLNEIGLDLTDEFSQLEKMIEIKTYPRELWRPITTKMYNVSKELGFEPRPTPKAIDPNRCVACGLCELGCKTGARWDSRVFLEKVNNMGGKIYTNSPVQKLLIKNNETKGIIIKNRYKEKTIRSDVIVLAAGAIGTTQIILNSNLNPTGGLWVDVVLTLGGVYKNAKQLKEPPMVWFSQHNDYILSPYLDILSHWFHKPWRRVSINDRVGIMVKLADIAEGKISAKGDIIKRVSLLDRKKIKQGMLKAKMIMESAGVKGPFVEGMLNGGHHGGTIPLRKKDVSEMKPSWLPHNLWIADLSLVPKSQGMPTMLLAAAIGLRTGKIISENLKKFKS
jgi:choline dehydrogenase-like flavoprotein